MERWLPLLSNVAGARILGSPDLEPDEIRSHVSSQSIVHVE